MIARFDLRGIDKLKEALPRFTHTPLPHLSYLKREQIEGFWLDDIAQDLKGDSSSTAFASNDDNRINGLALYGDSSWDTKVIGERVAVIKHLIGTGEDDARVFDQLLDEVLRHAASRGVRLVTCKVQPLQFAAIHALERHGFLLMDTLIDFVFDFSRTPFNTICPPQRASGLDVRLADPEDLPELLGLTEIAFAQHFGRYNSDPEMPAGTGIKVYQEWVRSSFNGAADWILIAEINKRIAGYSVWKKGSALEAKHSFDIGRCTLAGIHPEFFGRGLYTTLTFEGMRITHDFANHLDAPTHVSHYPVQRAMLKLGWKIAGVRHSFHKWLPA